MRTLVDRIIFGIKFLLFVVRFRSFRFFHVSFGGEKKRKEKKERTKSFAYIHRSNVILSTFKSVYLSNKRLKQAEWTIVK